MKLKDALSEIGRELETPEDRKKREQSMNRKRQREWLQRQRDAGLTAVTVHVPVDAVQAVRALEKELQGRLS